MDILVDYTGTGKDFPSLPFPLRPIAVGEGATKSMFLYKNFFPFEPKKKSATKINQKYANKKHIHGSRADCAGCGYRYPRKPYILSGFHGKQHSFFHGFGAHVFLFSQKTLHPFLLRGCPPLCQHGSVRETPSSKQITPKIEAPNGLAPFGPCFPRPFPYFQLPGCPAGT